MALVVCTTTPRVDYFSQHMLHITQVKTKILPTCYFFTDLWNKASPIVFQNEDCIKVPGKYVRILDVYNSVSSVMELLLWWVNFQNDLRLSEKNFHGKITVYENLLSIQIKSFSQSV